MFLNSSKKGAVLVSFGSTLRDINLSAERIRLFVEIFRDFSDYNFLWKFESNQTLGKLTKNVYIRPWLPQSDILAHPKLKVFITHGG